MRTVLAIRLPEKVASELDDYAQQTGRNKSDVVTEALTNYLWEKRFNKIKKKLIRRAKLSGFISDNNII
jgi:metal-responsive CopG/Arc/MetJ family transcriptional regulator